MKRLHRRTSIVLDQTNCEAKARPKSNIQNFPKGPETQNKAFARECYTNSQGHSELQPLKLQNISISRVFKNAAFAREGYHKLIDKAMQSEGGDMKRAETFQDGPEPRMYRVFGRGAQKPMETNAKRKPRIIEIVIC